MSCAITPTGHRDFILCLGYRADAIKEYFLRYEEALSNDFVLSDGGRQIELLGSDIQDWRITFADTGLDTTIGERLSLVRHHLEGEELFLANYGDTLTDAPLDRIVAEARERRGGDAPQRAAAVLIPRRTFIVGRSRVLGPRHRVRRDPDQRWRIRPPPDDLRPPPIGARPGRRAVSPTRGGRSGVRSNTTDPGRRSTRSRISSSFRGWRRPAWRRGRCGGSEHRPDRLPT